MLPSVSGAIPEPIIDEPTFEIKEGRNLQIKCSTKGTFAKLSWEKEGVKVNNEQVTDKPLYYVGGMVVAESILTIEDVTLQDSGIYKCTSVSRLDKSKKASVDARVNVKGILKCFCIFSVFFTFFMYENTLFFFFDCFNTSLINVF